MPARRNRILAVAVLPLLLAAGCGKSSSRTATEASAPKAAPVAPQGSVNLVTRNTTRLGGVDVAEDAAAVARAVYPALTSGTRPQLVVLVDEDDWPAALAASVLSSAPISAPILYTEGSRVPEVTEQTLRALAPTGAASLGGTQVLALGPATGVPRGLLARSLPLERPAPTAAAIEQVLAGAVGVPRQVIVVPANAPRPLMMPAASLSAESGAPILYVTAGGVPAATARALKRLHRPSIYLVDASALQPAVRGELAALGTVSVASDDPSAAGQDAVTGAIDLARYTDGSFGWGVKEPGHGLVFASTLRPLDAPAAALLSATGDYGPLLLLEGPAGIAPPLAAYLADIQPAYTSAPEYRPVRGVYNHGWVIGDQQAITPVTQAEIDSLLEISPRRQGGEEQPAGQVE